MASIRLMRHEDYEPVYALWSQIDGMGLRSLDDSREGISRYLQRNPSTCFVAVEADAIVGVILAGHDGRRGFLYHLAVAENHRGQAIGSALLAKAVTALEAEGIHKASLVVKANNELGNIFWQAKGWTDRPDLVYRNQSFNDENQ